MKTLQIKIECGMATCAREKGKFCQYVGSRNMGTSPICTLFPDNVSGAVYTELEDFDGWLQRCNACLMCQIT